MKIYTLNEIENAALKKFQKKHAKKCYGVIATTFTSTGVGMNVTLHCTLCDKRKDITDYGSW